ncbi:probable disease resistance protein At5g43730 [Gossypium hirsutum]|uniref:Probable disease resistance protein At5g43730 n=1 Tax=Gossypium hirsutum TaxID=3635 RepID=A0A1U8MFR8_GOSHI|nr:probable disease resistance protein At5g43730 [Gossypium hirsutum]
MSNHIKVLRETPKCPNLRTLFLGENNLQVISDGFFHFIPRLTVLNLSRNYDLEELPKGISQLISLECLDLSSTGIRELPIELKSLTKLKMLDLSNMLFVRKMKIPRQLISSFSKLQIFKLRPLINRDYPDEEEDNVLNGVNEDLIKELKIEEHIPGCRTVEVGLHTAHEAPNEQTIQRKSYG